MTETARVNPFKRPENRRQAAPALRCTCEGECRRCHIAVDNAQPCYETFQEVLQDAGTLQESGLFVVAQGPSRCGKTSLLNRCATWAARTLATRDLTVRDVSLTNVGQTVTITERVRKVGERLAIEAGKVRTTFQNYKAPAESEGRPPTLEDYMRAVGDAVQDGCVLVVRTPRAESAAEVAQYWSGTSGKLLILAETTEPHLPGMPEEATLRLNLGPLKSRDIAEFATARISIPGRGVTFPDLDTAALETFWRGLPMVTIGTLQKFLYNIYDHYLHNDWPDGNIIRADDIQRYVQETAGGQEGRPS